MELEIVKEKDTPLLSRKRISAYAYYEGSTPSRPKLRKEVAKKLGAKPEHVVLRHIYTRFGQHRAKLIVHVYSDEATMVRLEGESLVQKHNEKPDKSKSADTKTEKSSDEKPSGSISDTLTEKPPKDTPAEKPEPTKEASIEKESSKDKEPEEKPSSTEKSESPPDDKSTKSDVPMSAEKSAGDESVTVKAADNASKKAEDK